MIRLFNVLKTIFLAILKINVINFLFRPLPFKMFKPLTEDKIYSCLACCQGSFQTMYTCE